ERVQRGVKKKQDTETTNSVSHSPPLCAILPHPSQTKETQTPLGCLITLIQSLSKTLTRAPGYLPTIAGESAVLCNRNSNPTPTPEHDRTETKGVF
ncbi:hypothetical protein NEUTE2DRAFT_116419, partial [Neurospora tetrasperma FGSC 2509]